MTDSLLIRNAHAVMTGEPGAAARSTATDLRVAGALITAPRLHAGCLMPSIRRLGFAHWRGRCGRWGYSTARRPTTG